MVFLIVEVKRQGAISLFNLYLFNCLEVEHIHLDNFVDFENLNYCNSLNDHGNWDYLHNSDADNKAE